ncbi:flagellar basal body P-ring protein FlgI [Vibrio breoganii]
MLKCRFIDRAILGLVCIMGALMSFNAAASSAPRPISHLVNIYGERPNFLSGVGIVVGLDGTGDKTQVRFTQQAIANMVRQHGIQLDPRTSPKLKNVATVSVTATYAPGMGAGQAVNVTVSSMGDASSLRGGTLIQTELRGANGEVYALAQGNLVAGGFSASGADGSSITSNTPTAAVIPNGATLERFITEEDFDDKIRLQLKDPNYTTALNISTVINEKFGAGTAKAQSMGEIHVTSPKDTEDRVRFISMFNKLPVQPGGEPPRVVFNSRSGVVVITKQVTVSEVALSLGGLTINISENPIVAQPPPFSMGETTVINNSGINITEHSANALVWPTGTSLQDVVDAVNAIGASPDTLMQILYAFDEAGALNGELIVI